MRKIFLALTLLCFASSAWAQDAISIANEAGTGTALNKLAKLTGAPSTAIIAGTSDTSGVAGIVLSGAGTTGNALLAKLGTPNCVFDATSVVAGDYVQISSTVAGACHDAGATAPTSGQVIGRALASGAGGSTIAVDFSPGIVPASSGSGTGANPSATAGPTAVNGVASTFMRSDGAPAVQKGTNAQFGIVEGDGSTITCVLGVCTAIGGSATSIVPGTTTIGGATSPCLIENSTGTTMACAASATAAVTWLGTPSSANLAAALTDETGTGAAVFAGSPALTGTPTAPTATLGTNTTQVATTAFVIANAGGGSGITCESGSFTVSNATCVWSQTASGSAEKLEFTGLTKDNYDLDCFGIQLASGTNNLGVQLGQGSTTWNTTANYFSNSFYNGVGFGPTNNSSATLAALNIYQNAPTSTEFMNLTLHCVGLSQASVRKMCVGEFGNSGSTAIHFNASWTGDTNAITAIRLIDTTGTPVNLKNTTKCVLRSL